MQSTSTVGITKLLSLCLFLFIGDIVGLNWSAPDGQDTELDSGIVTRTTQNVITVAFDESSDNWTVNDEGPFKLTKLANDVTYKRIKR